MRAAARTSLPILLVLVQAASGCRCSDEPGRSAVGDGSPSPISVPDAPPEDPQPAARVDWGPVVLSSGSRAADGIATALGVGQAAITWIEYGDPGAEVYIARVADQSVSMATRVTSGSSCYPPTAVAWTGQDFALAFGDDRTRHIEIYVARISATGQVALKPRRLTDTVVSGDVPTHVASADSSQSPTLAYYDGQLVAAWGGPGPGGVQQVYLTTLAASGKPLYDPEPITSGPSEAVSIRLESRDTGASLAWCVRTVGASEMYVLDVVGKPPSPSQPLSVARSDYSPCTLVNAVHDAGSVLLWAHREQDPGGALEDSVMGQVLGPTGEFVGASHALQGIRLVKFPGKHRSAFDALALGSSRLALAWAHREHDGSTQLRVGSFDTSGRPLGQPVILPALAQPTDPHLVGAGQPGKYLVVWLDRPHGGRDTQVMVAGVAF